MQNADETEPPFKSPLRILGKGLKGLIDSGKQDVQGRFSVGQYNGIKAMWQGEYQVEVTAGQQFCFAVIEPFFLCQCLAFGAMPIAA